MANIDWSALKSDILVNIQAQADAIFPEFRFKRISRGWEAQDGNINGDKAKGHLYYYDDTSFCFKNQKTDEAISVEKYIREQTGKTGVDLLREMAARANYPFPDLAGYSPEKAAKVHLKESLLEEAMCYFQECLRNSKGRESLQYLKVRGYEKGDIEQMGLGHYPGYDETRDILQGKGYDIAEIEQALKWCLRFNGKYYREDYKVVFAHRDPAGRILALWGRLIRPLAEGERDGDKYKPLTDAEGTKQIPFNIDRARGKTDVVIVEGYFDALLATQRGLEEGIIAVAGAQLTESQLDVLVRYRAKNIILALDSDQRGREGAEKTVDLIRRRGLKAFVAILPEGYKDPDELITREGMEALRETLDNAITQEEWKAGCILGKHSKQDLQKARIREAVIEAALEYDSSLPHTQARQGEGFLKIIAEATGYTIEGLMAERTGIEERKARERLKQEYEAVSREGHRLLQEGRAGEFRELLEQGFLPKLRTVAVSREIAPYSLEDLKRDIAGAPEGLQTGYENLDKLIAIPQEAITIIGGRPSHGKTTFLMNLLLNMVEGYPGKVFFFFSYEESRKQIGLKLLNILSGDVIDEKQNLIQLERYIKGNNESREKVEVGKKLLKDYTDSQRLWIIDEPYFVDDLADTLTFLKEGRDIGAVFIDYIQKIKTKGRFSIRQLELQKVSEKILETAKELHIPIIMGAQLGRDKERSNKVKLDNLREAGDIEQDANLVIGLFNEAMEGAQDEGQAPRDPVVDLDLTILKNRNGEVNDKITLGFNRPILTITQKESEGG